MPQMVTAVAFTQGAVILCFEYRWRLLAAGNFHTAELGAQWPDRCYPFLSLVYGHRGMVHGGDCMNILLVEDDAETAAFIVRGLQESGDSVLHTDNARDALFEAAGRPFDVVILDRMLPGKDGLEVVRVLRQSEINTPILLLTALDGIDDRVAGLDAGADDYLVKPFAFAELYARVKALARRQPLQAVDNVYTVGGLIMERATQKVTREGVLLDLLPREYRILEYLMQHEGQLVTRTMLLEQIWGYHFDPKTSLVHTHVSRLRAKVDKPFPVELIKTVRGAGYIISAS